MTVTTTANSISYAGNGVTTAYAFPYVFFAPGDIAVTLFDTVGGGYLNPPPVVNGPGLYDYTVSGVVTDGEYASGGTVTFTTAPITGYTVLLTRAVPATQLVTLIDNTKFPAATINVEFDKLTVLVQQALQLASGGSGGDSGGGGGGGGGAGTITGVVAGIGLSGGGTSGTVIVDLERDAPGVVPIGAIVDFAGSVAPANWLLCEGQSLATTGTYGVLFTAIGYAFGGSGANFNLPDLRGRVTAGKEITATRLTAAGSGITGSTLGSAGGTQTHTLTVAQMPSHNHDANLGPGPDGVAVALLQASSLTITAPGFMQFVGGSQAHQNTQPTMVLNKIIRFA